MLMLVHCSIRLAALYKDLATIMMGEDGHTERGRKKRQQPKRHAADFLLQQMTLAGEEAR